MKENQIDWERVRIRMATDFAKKLMVSTTLTRQIDNYIAVNKCSLEQAIAKIAVIQADSLINELKR